MSRRGNVCHFGVSVSFPLDVYLMFRLFFLSRVQSSCIDLIQLLVGDSANIHLFFEKLRGRTVGLPLNRPAGN